MKIPFPHDPVERVALCFLGGVLIFSNIFLYHVTREFSWKLPCDDISPLTQRVQLQSKVVGSVEIAGETCQMYNVFSEGVAYEDRDRRCMLSHATPVKLVSSKIVCPSGTSTLPLELALV